MFLSYFTSFSTWFFGSVADVVEQTLNLPLDSNFYVYEIIGGLLLLCCIAFLVRKVVNR